MTTNTVLHCTIGTMTANADAPKQAHNMNGFGMDNEKTHILRAENSLHIAGVTGSSPVSPTTNSPIKSTDGPDGATVASGSDVHGAAFEGFSRTEDGYLFYNGGRHYREPSEAIKIWWSGELKPGCNARVRDTRSSHPCGKTPKHDPDANGRPTKCGTHCAAAVAKREAKSEAHMAKWRAESYARDAISEAVGALEPALQSIANGHNDPRSLAQDVLKKLREAREAMAAAKAM